MIELFKMGGILFMYLITLAFFLVMCFAILGTLKKSERLKSKVLTAGNLALGLGALGMAIGWFTAASVIEVKEVSTTIIAGGLKVSLITLMYGLIVYCISKIIHLLL